MRIGIDLHGALTKDHNNRFLLSRYMKSLLNINSFFYKPVKVYIISGAKSKKQIKKELNNASVV